MCDAARGAARVERAAQMWGAPHPPDLFTAIITRLVSNSGVFVQDATLTGPTFGV
jgi:hypothetical protein